MAEELPKPLRNDIAPHELEGVKYYKTGDLIRVLGISRSAFYSRLKELDLTPRRIKQSTYLAEGQARELIAYIEYLSRGGNLQGWKERQSSLSTAVERGELEAPDSPHNGESGIIPLEHLEWLSEAAREGWWLSTAQLAELLGVTEGTIPRQGVSFSAYGFEFERIKRWGRQLQWVVRRVRNESTS